MTEYAVPVGIVLLGAGLVSWDMRRPSHDERRYRKYQSAYKHGQPEYMKNGVGSPKAGPQHTHSRPSMYDPSLIPVFPSPGVRDDRGRLLNRAEAILAQAYMVNKRPGASIRQGR